MSNKEVFGFNITSLTLLVGCVFLFILCLRQCSDKEAIEQTMFNQEQAFVMMENRIVNEYTEEKKVLRDSIEYYKELVELNKLRANKFNREVKQLQADLATIESKVVDIPFDSSYAFLHTQFEPVGVLEYPFAGNQVQDLHVGYLEGIQLKEITKNMEFEAKYLNESLIASGEMVVGLESEITACDQAMSELGLKLAEEQYHNEKLKKKVWTNRTLSGVISIIAILALL